MEITEPVLFVRVPFARSGLIAVLLMALALRIGVWPGRYDLRDVDETGYSAGGVALFEGITPGYKNAPGGPLFWSEWVVVAATAGRNTLHPTPEERVLPVKIRIFAIIERALFDHYHDLSGLRLLVLTLNLLTALLGVYGAFRYGLLRAGLPGAVAVGGLAACLPLFLELGAQSRPYAMSWSFLFVALGATTSAKRPVLWTVLAMGFALGTRVEGLLFLPLLWWELWDRKLVASLTQAVFRVTLGAAAVALLISPWMSTNVLGMLRAIGTIQVATNRETSFAETFSEIVSNGLLPPALALVGAVGVLAVSRRSVLSRALLGAYLIALLLSTFKATGFGLHHKGPQIVGLIAACVFLLPAVRSKYPRGALGFALALLAWPTLAAIAQAVEVRRFSSPGDAPLRWIERYIPAGTRVYVPELVRTLLPTPAAAEGLWTEVTAVDAYERKLNAGLKRFKLAESTGSAPLPRALSEENLIQERGSRRRWFLLGADPYPNSGEPRYNVVPKTSQVFGTVDPEAAFLQTGGVLIRNREMDGLLPDRFPAPDLVFKRPRGIHLDVYLSPDVRSKLPAQALAGP